MERRWLQLNREHDRYCSSHTHTQRGEGGSGWTDPVVAVRWCAANASCEGITFKVNTSELHKRVYFKRGVTLNADTAWGSRIKATHAPPGPQTQQIWVKRVSPATDKGGPTMAVLFVNAGPTNCTADFGLSLAELGITSARGASVRNIWKLQDEEEISAGGSLNVSGVAGHSSRFYKITPK